MKPVSLLTLNFAHRMVSDLASNNTLRGAWAEQLVAHYIGIDDLPPNWSYYDMRDGAGRDISVKHSVGPNPSFSVSMNKWAWDPELRRDRPETEGWRGGEESEPQYSCHAYVFAWLEADSSAPPLDDVLNPDRWVFAVLARSEMYRHFGRLEQRPDGSGGWTFQKNVGLATLRQHAAVLPGARLVDLLSGIPPCDDCGVEGVAGAADDRE